MNLRHNFALICPTLALGLAVAACSSDEVVGRQLPILDVSPKTIDFGEVQVGTTADSSFTIKNTGTGVLTIKALRLQDDRPEFRFETGLTAIPPGGSTVVRVFFTPTETGPRTDGVVVAPTDDVITLVAGDAAALMGLQTVPVILTGVGATARLEVTPAIVSFGNVVVQSTKTLPITVKNVSSIPADIEYIPTNNVKSCGSSVADPSTFCFAATTKPLNAANRFSLAPGEETTVNVSFTPVIAGTRERGAFRLKACADPSCDTDVRMDGLGIEQGFRCEPAELAFGQVNPGSCATRSVECTNVANEQVTVVGWGPSTGANPTSADFRIEPYTTAAVLQEGDSIQIDADYCPNELGNDQGEIVIETDNTDPRRKFVSVRLTGTGGGPDIEVSTSTINYGLVSINSPVTRVVTVQNVGFAPLEITSITVVSPDGSFTIPGVMPVRLDVGEFYDVPVVTQPRDVGGVRGQLIIASDDQDEPEVRVGLIAEGINLPPCTYEVVPAELGFGAVERGRVFSRAFEIRNTGDEACLLSAARMVDRGPNGEFSLPDGDVMSTLIPGHSSETIRVQFAPTMVGTVMGEVGFSISAQTPDNEARVELSGTGADATLLIVPNDLDFGTIGVGCAARARAVTLYNTGTAPVRLESIGLASPGNPAFTIVSAPNLPLTLAPGDSQAFEVGFRADAVAAYAAAVEIAGTINGMAVTYIVSLQGAGATDATQTDEFDQLGRPKVDILFVIDDSCSMSEEQTSLSANFTAFIQFAAAQALDYQIGVTTTDVDEGQPPEAGRLVPIAGNPADRIVTPRSQPSPEALFEQNANVGIDSRTFTEQGLEAAYLALSNPLIFGHNSGFLRQDAVLSIIFVSDEEDQSPGNVDFYTNFFLSIKGFRNTNQFTASSIVGDAGAGCTGAGGRAQGGNRYIEVANRTGGVFQSICTADWSMALEDLSQTAFGFKSRFFLTNQPVIGTIHVYVTRTVVNPDGTVAEVEVDVPATAPGGTVNWTYDYPSNSINFNTVSTPEPGAHIRIEYVAECL
jgi:hypothetical protein